MAAAFSPRHRRAVLYLTHFWDAACGREVAGLQRALGGKYDVIVAGFVDDASRFAVPDGIPGFLYTAADLLALDYPKIAEIKPHHLIGLKFFRDYPDFEQLWMIEYDVRYTGDWAELFQELERSKADLLATVIQRHPENPAWWFWSGLHTGSQTIPVARQVKVFPPLMRLSNAALRAVEAACKDGWAGHYEVVWPTAIADAGLLIEEIGGKGKFTPRRRYGRYYTSSRLDPFLSPGSFVYRPSFLESEITRHPARLWHPVKSAEMRQERPVEPAPTWRDLPPLQPLRRLRRRLRHGSAPRQP